MVELTDTDTPHAAAQGKAAVERDHMGRRVTTSKREAFRHDLPWIIAMVPLVIFLVGALSGLWGR